MTEWTWNSPELLVQNSDGWVPASVPAEPMNRDTLAALLPGSITAVLGTGEHMDLELSWDLSALPEEGTWTDTRTVTGLLPQPYALTAEAAQPVLALEPDGTASIVPMAALPSGTPPYEDLWVNGLSPKGTTIHLFDYWLTEQTWADTQNPDWLINKGINSGHALLFSTGTKNKGNWNIWTGNANPRTGIVASELENGYPKLSLDMSQSPDTNFNNRDGEESLAYLFDPDIQHQGKASYEDVQGLLQVDQEGYYYYSSQKNYAVYYEDTNSFTLYQRPGVQASGYSPNGQFSLSMPLPKSMQTS